MYLSPFRLGALFPSVSKRNLVRPPVVRDILYLVWVNDLIIQPFFHVLAIFLWSAILTVVLLCVVLLCRRFIECSCHLGTLNCATLACTSDSNMRRTLSVSPVICVCLHQLIWWRHFHARQTGLAILRSCLGPAGIYRGCEFRGIFLRNVNKYKYIRQPPCACHEGIWGSGGINPPTHRLCIKSRWVVSLTPRLACPFVKHFIL
jgi:hypothetical protein